MLDLSSLLATSVLGTQYLGMTRDSGSAFSWDVMGRALPFRISFSDAPSNVANLWSYWWNSLASYSGR